MPKLSPLVAHLSQLISVISDMQIGWMPWSQLPLDLSIPRLTLTFRLGEAWVSCLHDFIYAAFCWHKSLNVECMQGKAEKERMICPKTTRVLFLLIPNFLLSDPMPRLLFPPISKEVHFLRKSRLSSNSVVEMLASIQYGRPPEVN